MERLFCHVHKDGLICREDEPNCEYAFDLVSRSMVKDDEEGPATFAAGPAQDRAAREYFDRIAGTPDRLLAYGKTGSLRRLARRSSSLSAFQIERLVSVPGRRHIQVIVPAAIRAPATSRSFAISAARSSGARSVSPPVGVAVTR